MQEIVAVWHKGLGEEQQKDLAIKMVEELDPEGAIKELFVDRFSCVIPFRDHPLNKETEVIKRVTRKARILRKKTKLAKKEERFFSPKCSVMSILNGNKNMIERRF
jgi:hypothetical protein